MNFLTQVSYKYKQGTYINTQDIEAALPLLKSTVDVLARIGPEFQQAEFQIRQMVSQLTQCLRQRKEDGIGKE